VPGEGWLFRSFHVHPMLAYPPSTELGTGMTDGEYVQAACPDPKDAYWIQDSDEIFIVDVAGKDSESAAPQPAYFKSRAFNLASWVKLNTVPFHRASIEKPFRHHYTDLSERWLEVEKASARDVASIQPWLRIPAFVYRAALFADRVKRFALKKLRIK
jgi:hypothetical protein